jgi:hypothetical protein
VRGWEGGIGRRPLIRWLKAGWERGRVKEGRRKKYVYVTS